VSTAVVGAASAGIALDSQAIAQVGSEVVTAGEVHKAFAGLPAIELQAMTSSPRDLVLRYLQQGPVDQRLLARASLDRGALDHREVRIRVDKVYAEAFTRIALQSAGATDITDADIADYYASHSADYHTDDRVHLAHVLASSEASASVALARASADPTREGWSKLASDMSQDATTRYSAGDLGFITRDGRQVGSEFAVPSAVASAAFELADGAIGARVVQSPEGFHVLWRKGSVKGVTKSVNAARQDITMKLAEQRHRKAYEAAMASVRANVSATIDETALAGITVPSTQIGGK
jgi:hypothetical protein